MQERLFFGRPPGTGPRSRQAFGWSTAVRTCRGRCWRVSATASAAAAAETAGGGAVLILPGFLSGARQYEGMASVLRARGFTAGKPLAALACFFLRLLRAATAAGRSKTQRLAGLLRTRAPQRLCRWSSRNGYPCSPEPAFASMCGGGRLGPRNRWARTAPKQPTACLHASRPLCTLPRYTSPRALPLQTEKVSAELARLYEAQGRVALVGHSAGGWVARLVLGDQPYEGETGWEGR